MSIDRLSDSGIIKIAGSSPHLDALATLASDLSVRERGSLVELERRLHDAWALGANTILSWSHHPQGICLLVVAFGAMMTRDGIAKLTGFRIRLAEDND